MAKNVPLKPPAWNIIPRTFDAQIGGNLWSKQCPIGFGEGYMGDLADQLDLHAEYHTPHRVHVLSSTSPTAFTLPNGTIYITRGLLDILNTESELASIVGHEVGHSVYRTFSSGQIVWFTIYGVMTVVSNYFDLPGNNNYFFNIPFMMANIAELIYGIRDEAKSDDFGIYVATKAGYDPYGMYRALSAMDQWIRYHMNGKNYDIWHPPLKFRIQNALNYANELTASTSTRDYPNSWQFVTMKRMLSLCVPPKKSF